MKLTKQALKRIIAEEIKGALQEIKGAYGDELVPLEDEESVATSSEVALLLVNQYIEETGTLKKFDLRVMVEDAIKIGMDVGEGKTTLADEAKFIKSNKPEKSTHASLETSFF
jgi:hypothetical protein